MSHLIANIVILFRQPMRISVTDQIIESTFMTAGVLTISLRHFARKWSPQGTTSERSWEKNLRGISQWLPHGKDQEKKRKNVRTWKNSVRKWKTILTSTKMLWNYSSVLMQKKAAIQRITWSRLTKWELGLVREHQLFDLKWGTETWEQEVAHKRMWLVVLRSSGRVEAMQLQRKDGDGWTMGVKEVFSFLLNFIVLVFHYITGLGPRGLVWELWTWWWFGQLWMIPFGLYSVYRPVIVFKGLPRISWVSLSKLG